MMIAKIRWSCYLLVLLLLTQIGLARAAELDRCIDSICVGKDAPTFSQLKDKLGVTDHAKIHDVSNRSLCLYDTTKKTSIVLIFSGDGALSSARVDGIFLVKNNECATSTSSAVPTFTLRTERGIVLGMSRDEIISKIGTPTRVDNAAAREKKNTFYLNTLYASKFGKLRLHYEDGPDSLLFNQYGLDRAGKLISIWINDSP